MKEASAKPLEATIPDGQRQLWKLLGYSPRPQQVMVHQSARQYRYTSAVCHRRFGKTVAAVVEMFTAAFLCPHSYPQCFYIAPTEKSAKRIAWGYVQRFAERIPGAVVRTMELKIELPRPRGGIAIVQLLGSTDPDKLRGLYADFVVMDELAFQRETTWTSVVAPALADRQGSAMFISTPNGKNLFYKMTQLGLSPDHSQWNALIFKASETGIIPKEELENLRSVLSKAEYEREFEVSFEAPPFGSVYGETLLLIDPRSDERTVRQALKHGEVELWWSLSDADSSALVLAVRSKSKVILLGGKICSSFSEALEYAKTQAEALDIERLVIPAEFLDDATASIASQARFKKLRELDLPILAQDVSNLMDGVEAVRGAFKEGQLKIAPAAEDLLSDIQQISFVFDAKLGVTKPKITEDRYAPLDPALRLGVTRVSVYDDDDELEFDSDEPQHPAWIV